MKNFMIGLHNFNAAVIRHWKMCLVYLLLGVGAGFGAKEFDAYLTAPITVKNDCGLILDADDVGPDSRMTKIRTDKMIALTSLKFSECGSIPAGSHLYFIVRSSGRTGWLIAP